MNKNPRPITSTLIKAYLASVLYIKFCVMFCLKRDGGGLNCYKKKKWNIKSHQIKV